MKDSGDDWVPSSSSPKTENEQPSASDDIDRYEELEIDTDTSEVDDSGAESDSTSQSQIMVANKYLITVYNLILHFI